MDSPVWACWTTNSFNYLHLGWLDSLWLAHKQVIMSSVVLQEQENKHLIFIDSEGQCQLFASVLRLPGQPQHPLCCTMHIEIDCPMTLVCRKCLVSQPWGGTRWVNQTPDVEQSPFPVPGDRFSHLLLGFILMQKYLNTPNHRTIES